MAVIKGRIMGISIVLRITKDQEILQKHEVHLDREHLRLVDQFRGVESRTHWIERLIEEYLDGTGL